MRTPPSTTVALETRSLGIASSTSLDRISLQAVDWTVDTGELWVVAGAQGAGKTALLETLAGLIPAAAGEVRVFGRRVDASGDDAAGLRETRRRLGLVFDGSGRLFSALSVAENILLPWCYHQNRSHDEALREFEPLIGCLQLESILSRKPASLSRSWSRRVALARAIALDPQILMYDEPFVGQDPIAMGVLVRLIRLLNDALGITSIVVSHDLAETASIADYLYVVGDGQVLGQGTPDELMNSDNPRIRQFMQGTPDGPVPFHYPAPNYRDDLLGGR